MDRWHKPDMDLAEGMELLRKCVDELEKRFIVNVSLGRVCNSDNKCQGANHLLRMTSSESSPCVSPTRTA